VLFWVCGCVSVFVCFWEFFLLVFFCVGVGGCGVFCGRLVVVFFFFVGGLFNFIFWVFVVFIFLGGFVFLFFLFIFVGCVRRVCFCLFGLFSCAGGCVSGVGAV